MTKITHFISSSFLLLSCWLLPSSVSAQLDSTTASISVIENYYQPIDSLDERDMAVLVLTFDDISDVGYVNVVVINTETDLVISEFFGNRSDMETNGVLLSDRLEFALFEPLTETEYRIEVSPMNLFGAYTKMCFLNLSL